MRKVRSERYLTKCHAPLLAVVLVLPLVAGCSQEVPYAPSDNGASSEQPAGEESATEQPTDAEEAPAFHAETPSLERPAAEEAREGTSTETAATPGGSPWGAAAEPTAPPEEAGDLFAAVDQPARKPAEDTAKPQAADEGEEDAFGAILDRAYGATPAKPESTASPTTSEPSAGAGAWWDNSTAAPTGEAPTEEAPPVTDAVPTPSVPEPKAPSATASSDADLLGELWGDDEPEEPKAPEEPAPAPAVTDWPAETTPMEGAGEGPLTEEPSPAADDLSIFDEPEADPADTAPEPNIATPEVAQPDAAQLRAAERAAPMAADAMKPLPAVPVLEFNTRHLAWLLGGKLGLAELADLDGATPSEVAEWRSEVGRLSQSLRIATPNGKGSATSLDDRVQRMLSTAAGVGVELKREHGADHAALMEIALKTNALLVVANEHPDLAASVGRAVEDAAERAMLPKFLWEDAVRTLKADPNADEVHDAVVRLHERVESFLR